MLIFPNKTGGLTERRTIRGIDDAGLLGRDRVMRGPDRGCDRIAARCYCTASASQQFSLPYHGLVCQTGLARAVPVMGKSIEDLAPQQKDLLIRAENVAAKPPTRVSNLA